MTDIYSQLGVSHSKKDFKKAIASLDVGLFEGAFCKAIPDLLCNDADYCMILHADGAGTKSSLAWLYYSEYQDYNVFKGIAQDSLVMNLDDMLCVGGTGPYIFSNTIGRNAFLVDSTALENVIQGYEELISKLSEYDIEIFSCGGETADLGDVVRTIILDATLCTRMKRSDFINCKHVKPGAVIVGLSSSGKAIYETKYNSGIGSNGLTALRHMLLSSEYKEKYPETFSPNIKNIAYSGKLTLKSPVPECELNLGECMLSPTRTYAPIIAIILQKHRKHVSGIFHNSGGGQTKCLNFGQGIHYVKDNLFPTPPIFNLIKNNSEMDISEMYQVFNMGHRMELIVSPEISNEIIKISEDMGVEAKIIGKLEENNSDNNKLTILTENNSLVYES